MVGRDPRTRIGVVALKAAVFSATASGRRTFFASDQVDAREDASEAFDPRRRGGRRKRDDEDDERAPLEAPALMVRLRSNREATIRRPSLLAVEPSPKTEVLARRRGVSPGAASPPVTRRRRTSAIGIPPSSLPTPSGAETVAALEMSSSGIGATDTTRRAPKAAKQHLKHQSQEARRFAEEAEDVGASKTPFVPSTLRRSEIALTPVLRRPALRKAPCRLGAGMEEPSSASDSADADEEEKKRQVQAAGYGYGYGYGASRGAAASRELVRKTRPPAEGRQRSDHTGSSSGCESDAASSCCSPDSEETPRSGGVVRDPSLRLAEAQGLRRSVSFHEDVIVFQSGEGQPSTTSVAPLSEGGNRRRPQPRVVTHAPTSAATSPKAQNSVEVAVSLASPELDVASSADIQASRLPIRLSPTPPRDWPKHRPMTENVLPEFGPESLTKVEKKAKKRTKDSESKKEKRYRTENVFSQRDPTIGAAGPEALPSSAAAPLAADTVVAPEANLANSESEAKRLRKAEKKAKKERKQQLKLEASSATPTADIANASFSWGARPASGSAVVAAAEVSLVSNQQAAGATTNFASSFWASASPPSASASLSPPVVVVAATAAPLVPSPLDAQVASPALAEVPSGKGKKKQKKHRRRRRDTSTSSSSSAIFTNALGSTVGRSERRRSRSRRRRRGGRDRNGTTSLMYPPEVWGQWPHPQHTGAPAHGYSHHQNWGPPPSSQLPPPHGCAWHVHHGAPPQPPLPPVVATHGITYGAAWGAAPPSTLEPAQPAHPAHALVGHSAEALPPPLPAPPAEKPPQREELPRPQTLPPGILSFAAAPADEAEPEPAAPTERTSCSISRPPSVQAGVVVAAASTQTSGSIVAPSAPTSAPVAIESEVAVAVVVDAEQPTPQPTRPPRALHPWEASLGQVAQSSDASAGGGDGRDDEPSPSLVHADGYEELTGLQDSSTEEEAPRVGDVKSSVAIVNEQEEPLDEEVASWLGPKQRWRELLLLSDASGLTSDNMSREALAFAQTRREEDRSGKMPASVPGGGAEPILVPLWRDPATDYLHKILELDLDQDAQWQKEKLASPETSTRIARRQRRHPGGLRVDSEPPPPPPDPIEAHGGKQEATTISVATSSSMLATSSNVPRPQKQLKVTQWETPTLLILPEGIAYEPSRYTGTERNHRWTWRQAPQPIFQSAVNPFAVVASAHASGQQFVGPTGQIPYRQPPSLGGCLQPQHALHQQQLVQFGQSQQHQVAQQRAPLPPGYEAKLLWLLGELEDSRSPPDVVVRELWMSLSPGERGHFIETLPQYKPFIPADVPKARPMMSSSPILFAAGLHGV